jgi:acyl-CoA thioesterase
VQFSRLLQGIQRRGGEAVWEVHPEWMQGRAVFGGLQAVLAVHAMRGLIEADIPLRTLQVAFVAPSTSSHIQANATLLRQGKSATQLEARLTDGATPLAVVIGVFGKPRLSSLRLVPQMPRIDCAAPRPLPFVPGLSPSFTQHFRSLWLRGGTPFSGVRDPHVSVALGMPEEAESSEFHVLAMADFLPPVGLSWLQDPAPGSSMTWMLEILTEEVDGLPMDGWRADAEMVAAANGYTHQTVTLWGPQGQPVALSRQTMVVFG